MVDGLRARLTSKPPKKAKSQQIRDSFQNRPPSEKDSLLLRVYTVWMTPTIFLFAASIDVRYAAEDLEPEQESR